MKLQLTYCAACQRTHAPGDHAAKVTDSRNATVTQPVTGFVLPPVLDAMARAESARLGLSVADWIGKVFRQSLKPQTASNAERQAAYRARKHARPEQG